jgi:hypothetical protein
MQSRASLHMPAACACSCALHIIYIFHTYDNPRGVFERQLAIFTNNCTYFRSCLLVFMFGAGVAEKPVNIELFLQQKTSRKSNASIDWNSKMLVYFWFGEPHTHSRSSAAKCGISIRSRANTVCEQTKFAALHLVMTLPEKIVYPLQMRHAGQFFPVIILPATNHFHLTLRVSNIH